jgi:hypothetical protein
MKKQMAILVAAWFGLTGQAHAVFSVAPPEGAVPEPSTHVLLIGGVLAVAGLRYLSKRRRDK